MSHPRQIAVVTGSRAEFGLLRPVMQAIAAHPDLGLRVVVTGSHLLSPTTTIREVQAEFEIVAVVPMQTAGDSGRFADAAATGRGMAAFADWLSRERPDVVLVLGDRIEAFAEIGRAHV